MRIEPRKTVRKILRVLRLTPLSLEAKCRIMFGLAVVFSLVIALLLPYLWMRKLTKKVLLDTNKARAEAIILRRHFDLKGSGQMALPQLDSSGAAVDANEPQFVWIPHSKAGQADLSPLSRRQARTVEMLNSHGGRDDEVVLSRVDGVLQSDYVRIFRATEGCLGCHNPQGSARELSLNEQIGIAVIRNRRIGSDIRWTVFMNRVWVVVAGLVGGTGAIVAFYWVTQRVILRPIRQLRALANNVAEGNLDVRSSIATGDEYEKLARAFNHMLDNLQAARDNLREANKQLDAKIAELSERNIELFRANKLKSEFLANMSHEFRTPLNAILGFAQVLREKPGLLKRDKGRRYAENILSSGNSLLSMINDLLDLAKAQAGKMGLHVGPASVAQLCEAVVSSFSLLTRKKRIKVALEVDGTIPVVVTDAGKVQQILYNFVSNAVKFTPSRGRIDVRAAMLRESTVRISVSDTGCGIAAEDREQIFDKFRQLDGSITRESTGSGLGLAICKELASMLGGDIGLESEPGVGSTFWVDIPVAFAQARSGPL